MFFIIFFAFAQLGHLLFGSTVKLSGSQFTPKFTMNILQIIVIVAGWRFSNFPWYHILIVAADSWWLWLPGNWSGQQIAWASLLYYIRIFRILCPHEYVFRYVTEFNYVEILYQPAIIIITQANEDLNSKELLFISWLWLLIFIAIINDTYSEVKAEIQVHGAEFEITDYIKRGMNRFCGILGCGRSQQVDVEGQVRLANTENIITNHELRENFKKYELTVVQSIQTQIWELEIIFCFKNQLYTAQIFRMWKLKCFLRNMSWTKKGTLISMRQRTFWVV